MKDIIAQLRTEQTNENIPLHYRLLMNYAADELERLRDEKTIWRKAWQKANEAILDHG